MSKDQLKQVERERMRMVTVREVLKATIEKKAAGEDSFVPLYIALSAYLTTALTRLVDQDWRLITKIRQRVGERDGTVSDEVEAILDKTRETLCGALVVSSRTEAAAAFLSSHGVIVLDDFEAVVGELHRYMSERMGHGPGGDIAAKYFSADDWDDMSRFDDGVIERENRQYDAVFDALAATPIGLGRDEIEQEVVEMVARWRAN